MTQRGGRPLRRALPRGAGGAGRATPRLARRGRCSSATRLGPLPRANLSVKVSALTPLLRPEAPERRPRGRRRPPAPAAAPRARARRPPAHRHGVARRARDHPRARLRAARRGRVPRRALGRRSCSRPTCATRPRSSTACSTGPRALATAAAADRAAGEGRLLGPRGRRGAPARLGAAGVRGQGRVRPQLRGAHAPAARRAPARARGRRLAQPALGGPRHRLQPRARRRGRATSSCRCCAAWATSSSTRSPPSGFRVRAYCPVGDLVAGMAYLVRRLLENTSNDSFLRDQARGAPLERAAGARREAVRSNEPVLELRRAPVREVAHRRRWRELDARLPLRGARAGGRARVASTRDLALDRPGRPRAAWWPCAGTATEEDAHAAVRDARPARLRRLERAAGRGAGGRSSSRAAGLAARAPPRARRAPGARVRQAVGARPTPTCARRSTSSSTTRAARSSSTRGAELLQVPGERNTMRYAPRGVVGVIAPWNFPLAIPHGHGGRRRSPPATPWCSSRPSSRPACALRSCAALHEAGVPPLGASTSCPGYGDAGAALVRHPGVHVDRLHGLGRGGPARSCARRPRRPRARAT